MDEKETWQALVDFIEGMHQRQAAHLQRTAALSAVIRAVMVEWPEKAKPALAAKIRELATLRDDLSLNSTVTDEERAEYAKVVEHFATLLEP